MCKSCWIGWDSPTELPDNHDEIVAAINQLYTMPNCAVGGPLHVELDDMNANLNWKPWNGLGSFDDETMHQAQKIADLMMALPVEQRYAVLAKREGFF